MHTPRGLTAVSILSTLNVLERHYSRLILISCPQFDLNFAVLNPKFVQYVRSIDGILTSRLHNPLRQAVPTVGDNVSTGGVTRCIRGEVEVGSLELVSFTFTTKGTS